jgi:hypothetical protein
MEHAGVGQTFDFDRVVTNVGNCYNNLNGNFVALYPLSRYHNNAHDKLVKKSCKLHVRQWIGSLIWHFKPNISAGA